MFFRLFGWLSRSDAIATRRRTKIGGRRRRRRRRNGGDAGAVGASGTRGGDDAGGGVPPLRPLAHLQRHLRRENPLLPHLRRLRLLPVRPPQISILS